MKLWREGELGISALMVFLILQYFTEYLIKQFISYSTVSATFPPELVEMPWN